jgi:hypothetical protein
MVAFGIWWSILNTFFSLICYVIEQRIWKKEVIRTLSVVLSATLAAIRTTVMLWPVVESDAFIHQEASDGRRLFPMSNEVTMEDWVRMWALRFAIRTLVYLCDDFGSVLSDKSLQTTHNFPNNRPLVDLFKKTHSTWWTKLSIILRNKIRSTVAVTAITDYLYAPRNRNNNQAKLYMLEGKCPHHW